MKRKPIGIVSLASAIAAMAPTANASAEPRDVRDAAVSPATKGEASSQKPNRFFSVDDAMMGLVVSTGEDGSAVATHYSHVSHSSHSSHVSHHSHYSSS